jgi:N6-L-threonylcarbamoyladenine synthase
MIILGIETSCDDTAASIIKTNGSKLSVLSDIVSSQIKIHAKWGGVVPNLAAREHLKNIIPVLKLAFKKAGVKPSDINSISVTQGPGLIPALLIGTNVAKTLSYVWQKPLLGIHHIDGHIYANFITSPIPSLNKEGWPKAGEVEKIKFPILCLVVSGGHTQLILMKKHLDYKIVGETLDDAAGEAFDKVARILNLGYPGGPAISAQAEKCSISNFQFSKYKLPRPMINSNNLNFSFSGLKTAVLYQFKEAQKKLRVTDYKLLVTAFAHEFQQAAIDVLIAKTIKAAKIYNPRTIMLAGGVSANIELRQQLRNKIKKELKNTLYIIPDTSYSVDNAAMIAAAGAFRWKNMTASQRKKSLANWKTLQPDANLKLK